MGNCGRASNQCQGDWQTEKPGAPTCYGHALPAATGANGCHGPGSGVSSVVGVREGARQHLDCLNPTIALPPGIPWSPFTSPWNGLHGQQGLPYLPNGDGGNLGPIWGPSTLWVGNSEELPRPTPRPPRP
mmetsp:Transcript_113528/g.197191  ORF Transcript_113528/g.197191 Transcript_113528/m.197191 type:complete len:130 (-) Transcript_113528:1337-1726(-)